MSKSSESSKLSNRQWFQPADRRISECLVLFSSGRICPTGWNPAAFCQLRLTTAGQFDHNWLALFVADCLFKADDSSMLHFIMPLIPIIPTEKKKQTHKSLLKKKHFAKVSHSKSPLRSWKPWTHPRCDDPNGYLPLAPASHRCQPFLDVFFAMTAFSHMPARKAIQLPRTHGGLWDSLLYTSNLKDSRGYGCKKDRIWINIYIIYKYIIYIYYSFICQQVTSQIC